MRDKLKLDFQSFKNYYEIILSAFLCAVFLLLANAWFHFTENNILPAVSALLWQFFIHCFEKNKLCTPFLSIVSVLFLLSGLCFYLQKTKPPLPSGTADIADYFLFESQTGHCTYFAAAMAVPARCEGIPTRYVEGFVTNKEPAQPPEDSIVPENGVQFLSFILQASLIIILFLLLLLILFFAFFFIRKYRRNRAYAKFSSFEKIKFHMENTFFHGRLYGYPLEDTETLSDYSSRIHNFLNTSEISFSHICGLYESIRFGEVPVTEEMLLTMQQYTQKLQADYLKNCGKMKRLLYYLYSKKA